MTRGASPAPTSKRTADQIEDEIARTREELAETLGVLADKVNPRLQAARATQAARLKAAALAERGQASARSLLGAVKGLGRDVAQRRPTTLALVGAVALVTAGAIVVVAKHRH